MTVQTLVCQSGPTDQACFTQGTVIGGGFNARIQNASNPNTALWGSSSLWLGWFLPGINIPPGAQITSATMLLCENNSPGNAGAYLAGTGIGAIYGDKQPNPAMYTNADNPSGISKTAASSPLQADGTEGKVFAHDVTAIIQELVNQTGWASGNAMRFAGFSGAATGYASYYLSGGANPVTLVASFVPAAAGGSTGRGGILRSKWLRKPGGQGNIAALLPKTREDARQRSMLNWLLDRVIYRGIKARAKVYLGTRSDTQIYLGERDLL